MPMLIVDFDQIDNLQSYIDIFSDLMVLKKQTEIINVRPTHKPRWRSLPAHINGGDVQRNNVVNNVNKSSLWAPRQNGPYKNTQNNTKHGVNKDATDIKK